jgi:hypothetical protein
MDPAILDRLEGIGDLDELARCGFRVGIRAGSNELHQVCPLACAA